MPFRAIIDFFRNSRDNHDDAPRNLVNEQGMNLTTERGSKFLAGTLATWPAYWLIRGMDWSTRRGKEPLHFYINRTFYQAKLMQMFLLTGGFLIALGFEDPARTLPVSEEVEKDNDLNLFETYPF